MEDVKKSDDYAKIVRSAPAGEGRMGMQMYEDTVKLAISRKFKTNYMIKTTFSTAIAAAAIGWAYELDSLYLATAGGAMATIAIQQGKLAINACKKYTHRLEDAVSHGWGSREELLRIGSRYLQPLK